MAYFLCFILKYNLMLEYYFYYVYNYKKIWSKKYV